jgi:predicted phosphodiesterase
MQTRSIEVDGGVDALLLVSDLHSFIEPLEALDLKFASRPGSAQIVVAGDLISGGASPAEAVEWARQNAGEFALLGNHDETALLGGEGDHPPYSETGGYLRLDQRQAEYYRSLPHVLELAWNGHVIRVIHGHRTFLGENVSWMTKPSEMLARFGDPAVAITVTAHTHHPFVAEHNGCRVANCGSVCGLLLGREHKDGTISSWGDEAVFEAPPQIYSTFLALTVESGELKVAIERFDYDRAAAIQRLRDVNDPFVEVRQRWLETGVVRV